MAQFLICPATNTYIYIHIYIYTYIYICIYIYIYIYTKLVFSVVDGGIRREIKSICTVDRLSTGDPNTH